jgi:DNA helicase-2/ATP-dependent DNA helicase PcrA
MNSNLLWEAELNVPQFEAVQHAQGPLLILAGAGSGKTRVITYRIAYLIDSCHVPPEHIMAVTFTNKAAAEMNQRVRQLLDMRSDTITMGTFHATCARILRREATLARLSPQFVIFDATDQLNLIKQCMQELKIDQELYPPRTLRGRISSLKNQLIDPHTFLQEADDFGWQEKVASVYPLYQRWLRDNGGVDFDDLLMFTVQLFQRYPDVLSHYQNRWQFILVDEYQDTNMAQYQFLQLLAEKFRNLCVVGDDDQSVYRFRGANVRNILNFERDYPDAKVIKLEQNYRSTGIILEAANAVIAKNLRRKEKVLWTENERGTPIGYFCALDDIHEAEVIAQNIVGLHRSEGVPYRDMAVFYRTNAQSRVLEDALRRAGVKPIVVGLSFYDRQEIKDIMAYLRLLGNPLDMISLRRIINVPRRGIGKTTWHHLEAFSIAHQQAGLGVIESVLQNGSLGRATQSKLHAFIQLMQSLAAQVECMSMAELTRCVLEQTGYLSHLKALSTAEAQTRIENLSELVNAADDFDRRTELRGMMALLAFLEQTSLLTDQDALNDEADAVVLMTLHASKGLEFPVVFVCGMENGLFPHNRAYDDQAELEEERRLCYVGMTRAQRRLFLTSASRRRVYGTEQHHTPSLFLADIPSTCIIDYSVSTPVSAIPPAWNSTGHFVTQQRPALPVSLPKKPVSMPQKELYVVGSQVFHQNFGHGIVKKREGEGEGLKLTILFRNFGSKKVLASHAPMQPL